MVQTTLKQKTDYTLVETSSQLKKAVDDLKSKSKISFDVEGTSLDPYVCDLLLVQLASVERIYLFDARKLNLSALKPILENKNVLKLAQNAGFDYRIIKVKLGIEPGPFYDTMLAERILTTGYTRENSLEAIARKYLGIQLAKGVWETFVNHKKEFTKQQLEYAATDVSVLFSIQEAQKRALVNENLEKIAALEFRLIPVVAEMELKGFRIDVDEWRRIIKEYESKRNAVEDKIQNELRPHFRHLQTDLFGNQAAVVNLNSPIQILKAFRKVGLDLPSTGEGVLRQYDHPLAKLLLEYRAYEKIITAFGENLISKINPKTKRIHPDYMQIGADTGRFACSNPNLQQIPADSMFRRCFIASEGYKLVVADYSQIELRIMAELSRDPAFLKAFKEGEDLHSLTASQMFGVPLERVTKEKRFQAKSINFGLMYGRGARSLSIQLDISEEEAQKLLHKYFATYKKVKSWLDKIGRKAVRRGYSTTLGGRKRFYQELSPGDPGYERQQAYVERQGKNHPFQGTSGDMTKLAMVYIYEKIKEKGYDAAPIHTVHDEIVVEVKANQAKKVAKILKKEMERAGRELLEEVPVRVDVVISDCWEH